MKLIRVILFDSKLFDVKIC